MMQSIRGELTICTTGRDDAVGLAPSAVILGTAIIFIAWLWFSFRKRWHEPSIFATLASITVSIMLFSSPHTQNNDYVLFYIPCVWMWQSLKELRSNGRLKTFLKVTIASYPYLSWVFLLLNALFLIFRVQPYFAVNVIVFVLSLSLVLAESRTVPAQARNS
jgi:hypothetical protein